jgi:hypothetical protein
VAPEHRLAVALRRISGAHADDEIRLQARQRPAEVPLDVVVQRFQRRHVEEPRPEARALLGQPVDPVEERGERLARTGRRLDQRVLARGDRRPAALLRRSRRSEGVAEPRLRALREDAESVHRNERSYRCRAT